MKKVAVVSTIYYKYSHTDVILTRWFNERATDKAWGWNGPRSNIVSAYLEQRPSPGKNPNHDIGVATFNENNVPIYKTVHETLCCGSETLAVDGILLIGEHGDYPYNRFGQKLYPRKELFDKIVETFEQTGKTVPVFNDKHLSWDYDLAKRMIETSRKKHFPLFASSSLPFCHQQPLLDVKGSELQEVVAVYPNINEKPDHYSYHILELLQHCLERRKGFETGVQAVTAYLGEEVWKAQDANIWSRDLFEAALHTANPKVNNYRDEANQKLKTHAFRLEYVDGLNVTLVGLHPLREFALALRRKGSNTIEPSRCMDGNETNYHAHFGTLARVIEDFFWEGVEPFPLERALLTAGTSQAMIQAQVLPGVTFPTPHLHIAYQPSAKPVGLDYWSLEHEQEK
ncbi:MAG: hypothetical protein ACRCYY_06590 [Trueperaceae bacterium]